MSSGDGAQDRDVMVGEVDLREDAVALPTQ